MLGKGFNPREDSATGDKATSNSARIQRSIGVTICVNGTSRIAIAAKSHNVADLASI